MLNEMFWLMSLFESASFIGSQVLGNWLIAGSAESITRSLPVAAAILAIVALIYGCRGWKESPQTAEYANYQIKFHALFTGIICLFLSFYPTFKMFLSMFNMYKEAPAISFRKKST